MSETRRVDWKGAFTAIVTPFKADGSLDETGLEQLVKRQVDAGIHGLVPCGTTGESPALSGDEWARVIEITVQVAKGKAWVVAGTGTNNTQASVDRTVKAQELGVDGALVISPYYNKPTPDGLVHHFGRVAEAAAGLPIMVYNVPSRTGSNIVPDTVERLLEIPTIASVKEASGDLGQVWEVTHRFGAIAPIFSGEDAINLPILEVGGAGFVSVLSNVAPELAVKLYDLHAAGKAAEALELHNKLLPLCRSLFVETSPGPVKHAFKLMGLPGGDVREPLAPIRPESENVIGKDLRDLGLL